jgi:hypothetical protein
MRILLSIFVLAAFLSCNKKEILNGSEMWECHSKLGLDSAGTRQKLIGAWDWKYRTCPMTAGPADKNVTVAFTADGKFTVDDGSFLLTQGTWYLKPYGTGGWQLETSVPAMYVTGCILFCDKKLMFSNLPVDGCDYLFEKD